MFAQVVLHGADDGQLIVSDLRIRDERILANSKRVVDLADFVSPVELGTSYPRWWLRERWLAILEGEAPHGEKVLMKFRRLPQPCTRCLNPLHQANCRLPSELIDRTINCRLSACWVVSGQVAKFDR